MAHVLTEEEVEKVFNDALEKTRKIHEGNQYSKTLRVDWMKTPMGTLFLAGDDERIHLLSNMEQATVVRKTALVQKKLEANLEPGTTPAIESAKEQLDQYFDGKRRTFDIPLAINGTAFQVKVWEALRLIPFGQTVTYAELARSIDKPVAFRAVAQSSAQNPIAIVVPSHRAVNAGGDFGGAELERKRWLLDFEREVLQRQSG